MKIQHISRILFLGAAFLWTQIGFAQQEAHNTQFMYNKLSYNPGFAGSMEAPCITGIYRSQWLGLEGAPQTQILTFNTPLSNQRIGLGATLARHTVGISEVINLDAAYAYRFRLGRGYLGIGVAGSVRSLAVNFQDDRLVATQPIDLDPSIPGDQQQKFLLNFGAGAYYLGEKFYLGVSAPRLLQNNIDFADESAVLSREIQHFYMMAGLSIRLSDNMELQPQFLLKYVDNAPLDADANLSLSILEKYVVGVTYRLGGSTVSGFGESIDIILAGQISDNLLLGCFL